MEALLLKVETPILESDCLGHIRSHICLWKGCSLRMTAGLYKSKAIFPNSFLFLHTAYPKEICRKEIISAEKMMTGDMVLKNDKWVECELISAEGYLWTICRVLGEGRQGSSLLRSTESSSATGHNVEANYGQFRQTPDIQLRVLLFSVTRPWSLTQDLGPPPPRFWEAMETGQ